MNVVIVGGGFAGIRTAHTLAKKPGVSVTLISDKDHFVYYPALYTVATGSSTKGSFMQLTDIFKDTKVKIVIDPIIKYDEHRRVITGKSGKHYSFDRIVFALGVVTTYFGLEGLDEHSYSIKSNAELEAFKEHLHNDIVGKRHIERQYVIVGAGPTGVELAATLKDFIDTITKAHNIAHGHINIKLVEAAPRVLPRMSSAASALVERRLQRLGVQLLLNAKVARQDDETVTVNGHPYHTRTVVWTSGVANNPFFARHKKSFELGRAGKVVVNKHMMVNSHAYVIGDNALTDFSGLAQIAIKDADFVAKDILAIKHHKHRPIYSQKTPPVVIPVGDYWAIVEWKKLRISGFIGYMVRRAADMVGYLDVLPKKMAIKSWYANGVREYSCQTCERASY